MKFILVCIAATVLCSCAQKEKVSKPTVAEQVSHEEVGRAKIKSPPETPDTSSHPGPNVPSDDDTPIDKGTVVSFIENVTFKNTSTVDMEIRLVSTNDKDCAFSTLMKKNTSYTIETGTKLQFVSSKPAKSPRKHPYRVYTFSGPGGRPIDLACTDRTEMNYEEVRDAWEFRGESTVVIKTEK